MAGRPKEKESNDQVKETVTDVVKSLKKSLIGIDKAMEAMRKEGRSITRLVYARREITAVVKIIDVI